MEFIALPLYFSISKSKRLRLEALESFQDEEDECFISLSKACTTLGQKYNCNVSVWRETRDISSLISPISARTVTPTIENFNLLEEEESYLNNRRSLDKAIFSVHIAGSKGNAIQVRNTIVRFIHRKFQSILRTSSKTLFTNTNLLRPFIRSELESIELSTHTNITILGEISFDSPVLSEFFSDNNCIEVIGFREDVLHARIRLLSLLMSMNGYTYQTLKIPLHLIPIVAGKKNEEVFKIMLHTNTVIYLPPPYIQRNALPLYAINDDEGILPAFDTTAFIYGKELNGIEMAKRELYDQIKAKSASQLTKDIDLGSIHKRDWILKTQLHTLHETMLKTGTFFAFPPLGSNSTMVKIYGNSEGFIIKAARTLNYLLCEYYFASIKLSLNGDQQEQIAQTLGENQEFLESLGRITLSHCCEIGYQGDIITIYGTYRSLYNACTELSQLSILRLFSVKLLFESELQVEHQEFFVGKKNGKIKSITRSTSTDITLAEGVSENIVVSLHASDFKEGLQAFELIRAEYPAEVSFYVPEDFHKRVIGIKGANIQRLTSIHKAFVRFSNVEEHKKMGGYFENEDNVIARTPIKLSHYLTSLKREIFHPSLHQAEPGLSHDFAPPEYLWHHISVPLRYHPYLLPLVQPLKQLFKVQLEIPSPEYGNDEICIFGPLNCLNEVKSMLVKQLPLMTQIDIPASDAALALILHPLFIDYLVPEIKNQFNVNFSVFPTPDNETIYFLLQCDPKINGDFYSTEVFFFDFLFKNQIPFQSHPTHSQLPPPPNSPSSQAYLPYFNSRVMTPWNRNQPN